jgi:hypothetical protein
MVANITTGKDVYGALAYNQEKVDRGDGKVLLTHTVREPADGRFNVAATAEDLLRWMPSHYRTEKPVVHVSLNPAPEDRLDDGQLAEIAGAYMERMGWGGQPYIVFKHTDIGREHIHIVSVQVAQDGRKINDSSHQLKKNSTPPVASDAVIFRQVIFSSFTPFVPRHERARNTTAKSFVHSIFRNSPAVRSKFSRILSTTPILIPHSRICP